MRQGGTSPNGDFSAKTIAGTHGSDRAKLAAVICARDEIDRRAILQS
jgi:hypothetical protein